MNLNIQIDPYQIPVTAENASPRAEGFVLRGKEIALELPFTPGSFYRHGWQSWSLTTWQEPGQCIPESKPPLLQPMQIDPKYARQALPNGSWVGAVETPDGQVLLLGALGLETHVALDRNRLTGWCESGQVEWFVTLGEESIAFAQYASLLGSTFGVGRVEKASRVWCSWYSLYSAINEKILHRLLDEMTGMPFDVFQVDDGWEVKLGDWEANRKFPGGMDSLARRIRQTGFTPGLWLAPLLVVPSSDLYHQHSDWLLRNEKGKPVSAGFLMGEPLYALDTTHPAALDWLVALMKKVRGWGYDYVKLDFLYAGALPGVRHNYMPREAAYRHGLEVIREALGDAYLLTCGAPVIPSIGLCDGLRVGPDVAAHWDNPRDSQMLTNFAIPGTQNAIRTTVNRLWLAPLLHTDPDVAYFRSKRNRLTSEHKRLLRDLALVAGFKATADLPDWLDETEKEELLAFLEVEPRVERLGRYTFSLNGRTVDFSPAIPLPDPMQLRGFMVRWLAKQNFVMRLFDRQGRRSLEKMVREEYWSGDKNI